MYLHAGMTWLFLWSCHSVACECRLLKQFQVRHEESDDSEEGVRPKRNMELLRNVLEFEREETPSVFSPAVQSVQEDERLKFTRGSSLESIPAQLLRQESMCLASLTVLMVFLKNIFILVVYTETAVTLRIPTRQD